MMERSTIVRVREGLHARPATRFVKLAKGFEADIEITKADKSVSAKSSVKLMLLGVKEGDLDVHGRSLRSPARHDDARPVLHCVDLHLQMISLLAV